MCKFGETRAIVCGLALFAAVSAALGCPLRLPLRLRLTLTDRGDRMRVGMRDSGSSRVPGRLSTQLRASDGAYRIGASTAGR